MCLQVCQEFLQTRVQHSLSRIVGPCFSNKELLFLPFYAVFLAAVPCQAVGMLDENSNNWNSPDFGSPMEDRGTADTAMVPRLWPRSQPATLSMPWGVSDLYTTEVPVNECVKKQSSEVPWSLESWLSKWNVCHVIMRTWVWIPRSHVKATCCSVHL